MTGNQTSDLFNVLENRFRGNMHRHPGLEWADVIARLSSKPEKIRALAEMEATGGEPDVIGVEGGCYVFCDCAPESPVGRRSLCFDRQALDSRKENKPKGSALGLADAIGITMLSEEQYRQLQTLGEFDRKTSSWVATPDTIRKLSGALFCDRRYNMVFTYHNGAESYYGARGFRGRLLV